MILGIELFGPAVVVATVAVGIGAGIIHDLTGPRDDGWPVHEPRDTREDET